MLCGFSAPVLTARAALPGSDAGKPAGGGGAGASGSVTESLGSLLAGDEVILDLRLVTPREGVVGVSAHLSGAGASLPIASVQAGALLDDGDLLSFSSEDGGILRAAFTRKGPSAAVSGSGALIRVRLRASVYVAGPLPITFSDVHLIDAGGRIVELVDADLAIDVVRTLVPLPTAEDDGATLEETPIDLDVLANDAAGLPVDAGSVEIVDAPATGVALPGGPGGTITYTPDTDTCGLDTFTYRVQGADGHVSAATGVRVLVGCVNDPPDLAISGDVSVDEDAGPVAIGGFVSRISPGPADESSQRVALSIVADDPSLFVSNPTLTEAGTLEFETVQDRHGSAGLTVVAVDDGTTADGGVNRAEARFTITVRPVNDAPVAQPDAYFVLQNSILRESDSPVLGNDRDAEGDALAARLESGVSHGTLAFSSDGSFVYTPAIGFVGTDRFRYRAGDGVLESAPAEVTLTVIPDEDRDGVPAAAEAGAPNGGDGNGDGLPDALQENVTSLPIASGTKAGEYLTLVSPVGTRLTQVASLASNPSPDDYPSGAEPPVGFLSFQVHDLEPAATQVVTILLPRGVTAIDYLKYGPTPDDPEPHWYSFAYDGTTGALIHDETPDRQGSIELHFRDGARGDDDLVANGVLVDPGVPVLTSNRAPSAAADTVELDEDGAVTFDPLTNDRDDDGDALTVLSVSPPNRGTVVLESANRVRYEPAPDFHGADEFGLFVSDGRGAPVRSRVFVTVRPVNDPPRFDAVPGGSTVREGDVVSLDWSAFDVDGDAITFEPVLLPPGASLDPVAGTVTWTAVPSAARFIVAASDGSSRVEAPPVELAVHGVDRFAVVLAGVHLRPAVPTTATAAGEVRLVEARGLVEFDFEVSRLTAPLVSARVVFGSVADPGSVSAPVVPVRISPDGRSAEYRGAVTLSSWISDPADLVRRLRSGDVSLVVSTQAYPEGEAAGRLLEPGNRPPAAPSLSAPSVVDVTRPDAVAKLSRGGSTDPDGHRVLYILQVAPDAGFTRVIREWASAEPGDLELTADWLVSAVRGASRSEDRSPSGGPRLLHARLIASDGALWAVSEAVTIEVRTSTGVATETVDLPAEFALGPNYPNPFNPGTTLRFDVPDPSPVRLSVHDAAGREVRVLVDGTVTAGRHEARFEADGLPSGLYLYRLRTPRGTFARAMVLLR